MTHRRTLPLLAVFAATIAFPVTARAARIVTLDGPQVSQSRFVDPSEAPQGYYNEPPGVADRPNALKVDVYLPTGYSSHPSRRYPVLYLLHGHGDAYDSWPNPEQGDLMKTAKGFRGIVVMPDGDHGWYTNWWNGGRRGDPAWERYHLDQLLPFVEDRFRIRKRRRWHAIAGLSMGGEGTIFYASQRPGYFGSAASFSGVLSTQRPEYQQAFDQANGEPSHQIWGDPQAQEFYWAGYNPDGLVDNLRYTRLFVSVGDGVPDPTNPDEVQNYFGQVAEAELHQMANDFTSDAKAAGARVHYDQHQGIHAWRYWRMDLEHAIDWGLFKRPSTPHRHWTYRTVETVGTMWGLHFRFTKPPDVLETFKREGRTLSAEGSGRVAIRTGDGRHLVAKLPFARSLPGG